MYKKHQYYIYIITNPERTVLYTGVTNDLSQRLIEHWVNKGQPKTFAGKYYCYNLIYYEEFRYINDAIAREKEIKGWRRSKKLELIKAMNPDWTFLNPSICDEWPPKEVPTRFWNSFLSLILRCLVPRHDKHSAREESFWCSDCYHADEGGISESSNW